MGWNDLTDREKMLDRAIDRCGIRLDLSDSCACKVASSIGASKTEIPFIKRRIALRLSANSAINKADDLISKTENMLDRFAKDDEQWKRKGKALGFNFWDD